MEIFYISKKDYLIALGLVLLAFLIRIPHLSYPPEPVFDEVHYANFASRTLDGERDIDIHPPFARLIFAGILNVFSGEPSSEKIEQGKNFGGYPYVPLRLTTVLAGSFLAGIVYLISKKIYPDHLLAAIPPLMVVFDGALVAYSRVIMPDIYILFFGFLGILFLLLGSRFFFIMSGVMFGLAASIKWSALAFLATGLIYLFLKKKYLPSFFLLLVCLLAYTLPFIILGDNLNEIPSLTQAMFRGHIAIEGHPAQSLPWKWPFADEQYILWGDGIDDIIRISPNLFSWTAVFVSVFVSLYLVYKKRSGWLVFLLSGYLASYIPFYFVPRGLFLQHYFPALVFGFLLTPKMIKTLSDILFAGDIKKPAYFFAGGVVLFFLIFLPFIY